MQLRDEGEKVGVVKIRLWRPFPFEDFRKAVLGKKILIVIDRAISFGGPGGPVASGTALGALQQAGSAHHRELRRRTGRQGRVRATTSGTSSSKARQRRPQGDTDGFTLYGLRG